MQFKTMHHKPVRLIYTGGTIGMVKDAKSDALMPFDFEQIGSLVPELQHFPFEITHLAFDNPIDSSDVEPSIWIQIAQLIYNYYDTSAGFVVLHGTDTMAYTASMLSYLLQNLNKPVVFTGSQLPIGHLRTDAKENLITAIEIAGGAQLGQPLVPEVCIYFDYQLLRANRAIKYNAAKFEAFKSPNYPLLAESGIQIKYHTNYIQTPNKFPLELHTAINTSVASIKVYPGISKAYMQSVTQITGLKALILETFGSGNASTQTWFINLLAELIKKDCLIVNITQCTGGGVEMGKYQTSLSLKAIGVVSGYDLTFEACITRLMYLFGKYETKQEVLKYWHVPLRGEFTD